MKERSGKKMSMTSRVILMCLLVVVSFTVGHRAGRYFSNPVQHQNPVINENKEKIVQLSEGILRESFGNPDTRHYYTNFQISDDTIHLFDRPLKEYDENELEEVGKAGASLLRKSFSIEGVEKVWIEPYEFSVQKGPAFEWEAIEPRLIEALKSIRSQKSKTENME